MVAGSICTFVSFAYAPQSMLAALVRERSSPFLVDCHHTTSC